MTTKIPFFSNMIDLCKTYKDRLQNLAHLTSLEAKLALQSLISIIFIGLLFGLFFISGYVLLMLTLFFAAMRWLALSPLAAASLLTILNLLGLVVCYGFIKRLKQQLSFPATRRQLSGSYQQLRNDLYE